MKLFFKKGLFFGNNLVIDPSNANGTENVLITHAHSDHVKLNKTSNFFFSRQTKDLIESKYSKIPNSSAKSFGKKFRAGNTELSLHNAGHILGSSQVLLEGEKTIAVTSDFKLQDSLVQKSAEILPAETLVIESTFGLPSFKFPERAEVYEEMNKWLSQKTKNSFVILAGYALGKAQELTAFSSEYAGIVPLVHESIFENNRIYEAHGINLGNYIKLDHNLKESNVLIMPPSLVKPELVHVLEHTLKKKVFSAFASGWAYRSGFSKTFCLSDHADFSQLLKYVKESNPKMVFTMHGYSREFAGYVNRRLGIPAKQLEHAGQKILREFF